MGRFLILALAALMLCGCGTLRSLVGGETRTPLALASPATLSTAPTPVVTPPSPGPQIVTMAPIPNPPEHGPAARRTAKAGSRAKPVTVVSAPRTPAATPSVATPSAAGQPAIAVANLRARESSRPEGFVGGLQVFAYQPGQVYEVWTAPLRVTTLTLAPGEAIVSKAAGDTVRWQIGETTSGQGQAQRAHVMIKPLARGLETNLVLATSQRVYFVQLKSGPPETFNAAVSWDAGAALSPAAAALLAEAAAPPGPDPLVTPAGPLDARYRIEPKGRRPAWTPTAVMTDGLRTFLAFPPELVAQEAPALFVVGPGGETQLVNYRQQNGLWVVDRVFDQAELRVGDKHRQVVRIRRGGRS
jgi:type IV secretion system protein VirB9